MSLMLESVYAEHDGKPVLQILDLGYLLGRDSTTVDPQVDERFNKLCAVGIGKKNFRLEGYPQNPRLLMRIPAKKLPMLMEQFPIVEESTYWRTTHHWHGLGCDEATKERAG